MRIIIVDDSPSVRYLVKFTLEKVGHIIITAVDGVDALIKLKISPVDMVLTDLDMPRMNGLTLIEELRKTTSTFKFVPIVMLSTISHSKLKAESKRAGATGWITKPFKPATLVKVIEKILG